MTCNKDKGWHGGRASFSFSDFRLNSNYPFSILSVRIEIDELNSDGLYEKKTLDGLRNQVEELLTKYKESEIERFKADVTNQLALEEKEKEIEKQRRGLLELQKNDETLLQRYQSELETLREQLSEKKNNTRVELERQLKELFDHVIPGSKEITDISKKELEKYRKHMCERLQREWAKLDQHEIKLIEIEAEKKNAINEAEIRLKKERAKGELEKMHRLTDIEKEKKKIQDMLEGHIQERESRRKEHKSKEKEFAKCKRKLEKGIEYLVGYVGELECEQYKLSNINDDIQSDKVCELTQTVKDLEKNIENQQAENDKKMDQLTTIQTELFQKERMLSSCDENVDKSMAEFEGIRKQLADCRQQFGEELGAIVHIVYQERDSEVERIEKEKELLINQLLEHQIALETVVNDGFKLIGDENEVRSKEIRAEIEQLLRSASPGLERSSLESMIVEKKVQIHQRQIDLSEKERERSTLHDEKEQEFLALRQVAQHERENEQNELMEKIKSLEELMRTHGEQTEECAEYFELESSSLLRAQRYILQLDKELRQKITERREIDNRLENLNIQVNLQAESSQEQFRDSLEDLRHRARETEDELTEMKQRFQTEADHYLMRLR